MTGPTSPPGPGGPLGEEPDWAEVAALFGLAGVTRPLPGERTRNAALLGPDGVPVAVLKLHPAAEAPDIDLESAALEHLCVVPGLPRVLPAASGAVVVPVGDRLARALTWVSGRTWRPDDATPATLRSLGAVVAGVDAALAGFDHPRAGRPLRWNLVQAGDALDLVRHITEPDRAAAARAVLEVFVDRVGPALAALPHQLIHNDANDANIVLDDAGPVTGLIDFGDLCRAPRVCGLAVALAYAVAATSCSPGADRAGDPWRAVAPIVAGYRSVAPLGEDELALLPDLVRTRLAMSIAMAAWQHSRDPGNDYLLASQGVVWPALQRLSRLDDHLALARLRAAAGLEPCPRAVAVRAHLAAAEPSPVLGTPLAQLPRRLVDWSGAEPEPVEVGPDQVIVGRYREVRGVYTTPAFATPDGQRVVHMGVDLFVPAGTALHAPLDGVVDLLGDNAAPLDYGPVVVLRHETTCGTTFFSLYGHLSRGTLGALAVGDRVAAGEAFATVGTEAENGGWPPHLHLQLLTDLLGLGLDVPGVVTVEELDVWSSLFPDPNLILRAPECLDARG